MEPFQATRDVVTVDVLFIIPWELILAILTQSNYSLLIHYALHFILVISKIFLHRWKGSLPRTTWTYCNRFRKKKNRIANHSPNKTSELLGCSPFIFIVLTTFYPLMISINKLLFILLLIEIPDREMNNKLIKNLTIFPLISA